MCFFTSSVSYKILFIAHLYQDLNICSSSLSDRSIDALDHIQLQIQCAKEAKHLLRNYFSSIPSSGSLVTPNGGGLCPV